MSKVLLLTYDSLDYEITADKTPFTIGRLLENDLCVPSDLVSGHHGRVLFREGEFLFEDLGSTNGSLVSNGKSGNEFLRGRGVALRNEGSIHLGRTGPVIAFSVREEVPRERDPFETRLESGLSHLKSGDFKRASALFESLIEERPDYLAAYYYAGFVASRLDNLDQAILRFEQYLMMRRDDTGILMDLGKLYERKANLDKACHCYRKVLDRSPRNQEAEARIKELTRFEPGLSDSNLVKKTRDLLGDETMSSVEVDPFHVSYFLAAHGRILTDVMKALKIAWQEVGQVLEFYPPSPIRVSLLRTHGDVSGKTGPEGLFLTVDQDHLGERPFLEVLVRHEYAHYALGSMTCRPCRSDLPVAIQGFVPWWFQEGFSQYVSQTITPGRLSQLKGLANSGQLIPLQALTKGLGDIKDRDLLNVAYLEAHAAVAFLIKKRGYEGVRSIIEGFKKNEMIAGAFRALKWDYEIYESEWAEWLKESVGSGLVKVTREIR